MNGMQEKKDGWGLKCIICDIVITFKREKHQLLLLLVLYILNLVLFITITCRSAKTKGHNSHIFQVWYLYFSNLIRALVCFPPIFDLLKCGYGILMLNGVKNPWVHHR